MMKQFRSDLMCSFRAANAGVKVVKSERNFKVHILAALVVTILGLSIGLNQVEWVLIVITMGIVMATETVNTAIERLCDKVSSDYDPVIRIVKDLSAGAVLIVAIMAVIVGLLIFIPKIGVVWFSS